MKPNCEMCPHYQACLMWAKKPLRESVSWCQIWEKAHQKDTEKKFVFRGQECSYGYRWVSDDEFHFDFNLLGDKDFTDHEGDEYFMHCQHFKDVDVELCSPWYFERWYEHESLNACDYFPDKLTEKECEEIKAFMTALMNET